MFQLIVAVISIALVAALAIASIYYGGSAFNKGSLRANVTTLVNAGQQISGAQALYRTDAGGTGAADVGSLQTGINGVTYLSSAPSYSSVAVGPWQIASSTGTAYDLATIGLNSASDAATVCTEVNNQAGNGGQFYCAATATGPKVSDATAKFFVFKL